MLRPLHEVLSFQPRSPHEPSILIGETSRKDLEYICKMLNSKTEAEAPELRRLVAAWFDSGPNLKKMLYSDFAVWADVQNSWVSKYLPSRHGRAYIALFPPSPAEHKETAEAEARRLFAALTLNPRCDLLAGPCPRCGAFYLKKTRKQKVYCSQRCGSAATAFAAVRRKRLDDHTGKIAQVRAILSRLKTNSDKKAWKELVSKRTGLTVRWLSRAANKGELSAPAVMGTRRSNRA